MQDRLNAIRNNLGKRANEPLPNFEFENPPADGASQKESAAKNVFNNLKRFLTVKFKLNGETE